MRTYKGMTILTVPDIAHERRWKERLWSWPWQPWKKVVYGPMLKDGECLEMENVIYMNAATRRALETHVKSEAGGREL